MAEQGPLQASAASPPSISASSSASASIAVQAASLHRAVEVAYYEFQRNTPWLVHSPAGSLGGSGARADEDDETAGRPSGSASSFGSSTFLRSWTQAQQPHGPSQGETEGQVWERLIRDVQSGNGFPLPRARSVFGPISSVSTSTGSSSARRLDDQQETPLLLRRQQARTRISTADAPAAPRGASEAASGPAASSSSSTASIPVPSRPHAARSSEVTASEESGMINDVISTSPSSNQSASPPSASSPPPFSGSPFSTPPLVSNSFLVGSTSASAAFTTPPQHRRLLTAPRTLPHPILARRYPGRAGEWLREELERRQQLHVQATREQRRRIASGGGGPGVSTAGAADTILGRARATVAAAAAADVQYDAGPSRPAADAVGQIMQRIERVQLSSSDSPTQRSDVPAQQPGITTGATAADSLAGGADTGPAGWTDEGGRVDLTPYIRERQRVRRERANLIPSEAAALARQRQRRQQDQGSDENTSDRVVIPPQPWPQSSAAQTIRSREEASNTFWVEASALRSTIAPLATDAPAQATTIFRTARSAAPSPPEGSDVEQSPTPPWRQAEVITFQRTTRRTSRLAVPESSAPLPRANDDPHRELARLAQDMQNVNLEDRLQDEAATGAESGGNSGGALDPDGETAYALAETMPPTTGRLAQRRRRALDSTSSTGVGDAGTTAAEREDTQRRQEQQQMQRQRNRAALVVSDADDDSGGWTLLSELRPQVTFSIHPSMLTPTLADAPPIAMGSDDWAPQRMRFSASPTPMEATGTVIDHEAERQPSTLPLLLPATRTPARAFSDDLRQARPPRRLNSITSESVDAAMRQVHRNVESSPPASASASEWTTALAQLRNPTTSEPAEDPLSVEASRARFRAQISTDSFWAGSDAERDFLAMQREDDQPTASDPPAESKATLISAAAQRELGPEVSALAARLDMLAWKRLGESVMAARQSALATAACSSAERSHLMRCIPVSPANTTRPPDTDLFTIRICGLDVDSAQEPMPDEEEESAQDQAVARAPEPLRASHLSERESDALERFLDYVRRGRATGAGSRAERIRMLSTLSREELQLLRTLALRRLDSLREEQDALSTSILLASEQLQSVTGDQKISFDANSPLLTVLEAVIPEEALTRRIGDRAAACDTRHSEEEIRSLRDFVETFPGSDRPKLLPGSLIADRSSHLWRAIQADQLVDDSVSPALLGVSQIKLTRRGCSDKATVLAYIADRPLSREELQNACSGDQELPSSDHHFSTLVFAEGSKIATTSRSSPQHAVDGAYLTFLPLEQDVTLSSAAVWGWCGNRSFEEAGVL